MGVGGAVGQGTLLRYFSAEAVSLTFERADSPSGAVWRLAGANETLIPITPSIPEEAAVKALLDRYLRPDVAVSAPSLTQQ